MKKVELTVKDSGIATITLDNSKKRNVLSEDVISELNQVVSDVKVLGNKVKVLIICSKYPEFFSAGGDIKDWYNYDKITAYEKGLRGGQVFQEIEKLPFLTIAAISGSCLGGGNELALACDYRIATHDSQFGQPEVLLGNGLAWGGYYRLVKTVGLSKAKELILLGNTVSATEALNIGLINKVVSDWDELNKTVYEIAETACINSETIAISKHILNELGNHLLPNNSLIDALSASYFAETPASNRRKKAFLEKRLQEQIELEKSI